MSSSSTRRLEGFARIGSEVPFLNPHSIRIVGHDEDAPLTGENWFTFCPRAGDALETEWVDDIRQNGVRQPVDAWRDGNTVYLLEGRRRVTAARLVWDEQKKAGVPEKERISVRVNLRTGTPAQLFGYNVGSENRKARTPLQRAALMSEAMKYGLDTTALGEVFGCTPMTVRNTLALLELASDVQKAVEKGEMPLREAVKMKDMPREKQKETLTKLREEGATKGAAAANGIRAAQEGREVKRDTQKMRSRGFLEKWRGVVKKRESSVKVDLDSVLKFVLGGGVPRDATDVFKETLVEAGFRGSK